MDEFFRQMLGSSKKMDLNNSQMLAIYERYMMMQQMEMRLIEREERLNYLTTCRQQRLADDLAEEAKRRGKGCFPPDALVQLHDGRVIKLDNLRVGQRVMSSSLSGELEYSKVYFFAHSESNSPSEYIMICTARHKVKMTPDHHIYVIVDCRIDTISARKVRVGDSIFTLNKEKNSLEIETVIELTKSVEVGLYAPITMSGTIIVNDVLASCYVDFVPPKIAHPLLWPMRQLYRLSPSLSAWINTIDGREVPTWVKWFMDKFQN